MTLGGSLCYLCIRRFITKDTNMYLACVRILALAYYH